jgi:retron-type reverse transcriptase
VRDWVVHHALARVCFRYLDGDLHPFAHAYRPGRSGLHALDALEAQFQTGKRWVLRADIESFFDSIAHELLSNAVELATGRCRW